jgi:hypothetical protein
MVQYPAMRDQLIFTIRTLADSYSQQKVWIEGVIPHEGYGDCFDQAIHFLFDDMTLDSDLEGAIGTLLLDEKEAEAVGKVINALHELLRVEGENRSDEDFINSPNWETVLSSSRNAYSILTKGQSPDNFLEYLSTQPDSAT